MSYKFSWLIFDSDISKIFRKYSITQILMYFIFDISFFDIYRKGNIELSKHKHNYINIITNKLGHNYDT